MYCYDRNTCGNCTDPYSLQCSNGVYSTVAHLCVNTTSTQRFQQSLYSGAQFEIIAQWTILTTSIGYQQMIDNSTLNMTSQMANVGDILAFKSLNIGKKVSSDETEDYRCIFPIIINNTFICSIGNLSST